MYRYVANNLRRMFPEYEGWEINPQSHWGTYIPDFLVERRNVYGITERVPVEVKDECYIQDGHVKQLTDYMKRLAGRNVRILGGIFVVPSGAIFSEPALDRLNRNKVKIMRLRACSCR